MHFTRIFKSKTRQNILQTLFTPIVFVEQFYRDIYIESMTDAYNQT